VNRLAEVRKELLDLGLRNPLINYLQPRGKGLELTHLDAHTAFRQLGSENRSFHFRATDDRPTPFPLARHGEEQPPQLEFGTWLLKEQLEKRLLSTFYAARTSIEEQGVNTLFVVFGMLTWNEKKEKQVYRAPLILVPVELVRTDARQRIIVRHNGEEMGANIALIEKLRLEYGLKLPALPAEDDFDIADFFQEVRKAIQSQDEWTVDESAIALGFFSFSKFLMYHDLDPETWTNQKDLTAHPLLNSLIGDTSFGSAGPNVAENANLDEALRGCEPPIVDNCDSSQMLALVEASTGRSLVIQGPPGTGKSQTIVNLIAVALYEGKKVLFVSEKMAALEVVKRRLDRLHLGAACLELHSNKTNKKALIEELRRT
jgi:hypothetical protein